MLGKTVSELGNLAGDERILWCACFCGEGVMTCPNPFLVFEGFENLPRFPNPSLTGSHQTRCGEGEQILQVNFIFRSILRNVHGANLKRSELI
jgi:hypothetical protein